MSFNFIEFLDIIIPVNLRMMDNNYYVKGGRTYDFYFNQKTNSIDWDINGNKNFLKSIEYFLTSYSKQNKLVLTRNIFNKDENVSGEIMYQFGFQDFFYDDSKDPYFIDIVIVDIDHSQYEKINGINYMKIEKFFLDLIVTQRDRYMKIAGELQFTKEEILKNFNDEYKTNVDIKIEDNLEILKVTFDLFMKKRILSRIDQLEDDEKKYMMSIVKVNIVDVFKKIISSRKSDDEIMKKINKLRLFDLSGKIENDKIYDIDDMDEKTFEVIDSFTQYFTYILSIFEAPNDEYWGKFNKTFVRYSNFDKISWENLSNEYKIFSMSKCGPHDGGKKIVNFFDMNNTCKSYFKCGEFKIYKNTKGCIDNETKNKYEKTYKLTSKQNKI